MKTLAQIALWVIIVLSPLPILANVIMPANYLNAPGTYTQYAIRFLQVVPDTKKCHETPLKIIGKTLNAAGGDRFILIKQGKVTFYISSADVIYNDLTTEVTRFLGTVKNPTISKAYQAIVIRVPKNPKLSYHYQSYGIIAIGRCAFYFRAWHPQPKKHHKKIPQKRA